MNQVSKVLASLDTAQGAVLPMRVMVSPVLAKSFWLAASNSAMVAGGLVIRPDLPEQRLVVHEREVRIDLQGQGVLFARQDIFSPGRGIEVGRRHLVRRDVGIEGDQQAFMGPGHHLHRLAGTADDGVGRHAAGRGGEELRGPGRGGDVGRLDRGLLLVEQRHRSLVPLLDNAAGAPGRPYFGLPR